MPGLGSVLIRKPNFLRFPKIRPDAIIFNKDQWGRSSDRYSYVVELISIYRFPTSAIWMVGLVDISYDPGAWREILVGNRGTVGHTEYADPDSTGD